MLQDILFKGHQTPLGLSNIKELVEKCPPEFKEENCWLNHWSIYCMVVVFIKESTNIVGWWWKTDDVIIRTNQLTCFIALIGTQDLSFEDKISGCYLKCFLVFQNEF